MRTIAMIVLLTVVGMSETIRLDEVLPYGATVDQALEWCEDHEGVYQYDEDTCIIEGVYHV